MFEQERMREKKRRGEEREKMKDNIKKEYEGMTKINQKEDNRHTIQKFAIESSAVQVKHIQKSEIRLTDNIK